MDVPTVDFSGWPIFARREASNLLIKHFCEALEARKQRIQWGMGGEEQPPLPLERMCRDTEETPLDVPFHPAAERFWREIGGKWGANLNFSRRKFSERSQMRAQWRKPIKRKM